ncbi:LOW QUALITY PROTEIN: E3 ubiquitin-protein ligase Praja-2 [Rhynochetos jubatus]
MVSFCQNSIPKSHQGTVRPDYSAKESELGAECDNESCGSSGFAGNIAGVRIRVREDNRCRKHAAMPQQGRSALRCKAEPGSPAGSSRVGQTSSGFLHEVLLENTGTGEPICQSGSSQIFERSTSPFMLFSYDLEGNQISGNFVNPYDNSEDLAENASGGCNDLRSQNGIAFVNVHSYEQASSDGEKDDAQDKFPWSREAAGVFQGTLGNNRLSELEKTKSFTDFWSPLSALNHSVSRESYEEARPMPLMGYFSIGSGLACQINRMFLFSTENQAIPQCDLRGASDETQQMNIEDDGIRTPMAIANELNVSDRKTDQGNSSKLVVRPKIRQQNTANLLEREQLLPSDDEEESGSWRRKIARVQQGHAGNSKEMSSSMLFDSRVYKGHQKNTETDLRENALCGEQESAVGNSAFGEDFKGCRRYFSVPHKDEDGSEYCGRALSIVACDHFTASENKKSLTGEAGCESEMQSSSSGVEEDIVFPFQRWEQILLKEIEVPQLQDCVELEMSRVESDLAHDILSLENLLLDQDSLEVDSSVSDDLDEEWRYCFFFIMGLGQKQCCVICCSEYVKDEIITELPCHHEFHKLCNSLLEKSGTCPICRHVLAPMLPQGTAAPHPFLSLFQSPPTSIHHVSQNI